MAYRKVHVKNKTYEYVIGKGIVKIKGVGIFNSTDIGWPIDDDKACVTPQMIKDFIQNIDSDKYKLYLKSTRPKDWETYHARIIELMSTSNQASSN